MPSIVWDRHPEEAYKNPYEYPAQEQYVRECRAVISELRIIYDPREIKWKRTDESVEKAIWLLRTDAIDVLSDALELLHEERHRPAGRIIRDALETSDQALFFSLTHELDDSHVRKWYRNISPSHGEIRKWMKEEIVRHILKAAGGSMANYAYSLIGRIAHY